MTDIKGLDALQRKLKTLENFQRKLKDPMDESLGILHSEIATQKPKKKGEFVEDSLSPPTCRLACRHLGVRAMSEK